MLNTPFVAIDQDRLRKNIARMQALAAAAGVRLRPHTKTHKSPVIGRWQLEAGASGICCAKLGEAEVFADAGFDDIRLPYPINPANAPRVLALLDRTRLSFIVDSEDVARGWSSAMTAAGKTLEILVKVDVGFHRCGVDPDRPETFDVVRRIAELPGLAFRGLLSHAGHAYLAGSAEELTAIVDRETTILNELSSRLREAGTPVEEVSVGSTPTARFIGRQPGVTEMRPGNYVFFDRTQTGLEATTLADCALSIVATVVSRPAPDRAVFDAGSKVLSSDGVRGFSARTGYGVVYTKPDAAEPDETISIERLSEEHSVAKVPVDSRLRAGDRVRIVPNHSCVVANLANDVVLVAADGQVERLPVAARGRVA